MNFNFEDGDLPPLPELPSEEQTKEFLAREKALLEQAGKEVEAVAQHCKLFVDAFKEQGFTQEQSFQLLHVWFAGIVGPKAPPNPLAFLGL